MPLISFVIPVYKVGKYIENSMKSVCYQTFRDFEVVLVDNNTPDDSIEIAEKVLKEGNIDYRVVKQTIQGLPAARNMGIKEAKGEWIISIDPDDTVSSFFLEELYKAAVNNNLDIVFSEYKEVQENELFSFPEESKANCFEILDRDYTLSNFLTRRLPLMVSNMFFKKSYFLNNGFVFDQDVILGADLILLWRFLIRTEKVGHLNKKLYNHYFRSDSLITAPSSIKIASNLAGYRRVCEYIAQNYSVQFSQWVYSRELYGLLSAVCVFGEYQVFKDNFDLHYDKTIHHSLQSFPDKRINLMDRVLYLSPRLFFFINKKLRQPHSLLSKLIRKEK